MRMVATTTSRRTVPDSVQPAQRLRWPRLFCGQWQAGKPRTADAFGGHDYYAPDGTPEGHSQRNAVGGFDYFRADGTRTGSSQPIR